MDTYIITMKSLSSSNSWWTTTSSTPSRGNYVKFVKTGDEPRIGYWVIVCYAEDSSFYLQEVKEPVDNVPIKYVWGTNELEVMLFDNEGQALQFIADCGLEGRSNIDVEHLTF